nr:transport protein particle 20 kda subunit [Quercus suber]
MCQFYLIAFRHRVLMATTACFIIVSRNDIPIYEAEVGSATKREDAAQLHQFILHAALDIVQDLAWTTSAMFLKAIDRFNDLVVSVYVTAEVHELYIKILLNPLYLPGSRITSSQFDTKVRALARKYLYLIAFRHRVLMATTACFIIVSRNDIPIYEAEVGSATKREDAAQLHQFILHAALDIVQDLAWTTSAMFLKAIDRFNDLVVSVYVTAEVHELYIKILLNPLYLPGSRITSSQFDTKVRALARKYL